MSTPVLRFNEIGYDEILEFVDGDPSPRVDTLSDDRADHTIDFKVPGNKLIPFIQRVLGLAYVQGTQLKRVIPMYHPIHQFCFAKSVQIQGRGFRGDDIEAVLYADQVTPAKWEIYTARVSFDLRPYDLKYDQQVGPNNEYSRFVEKLFNPETEIVTVQVGEILYDGNVGDAWNNQPYTPGPGVTALARMEASGITLRWMKVPWEFLAANDDSIPLKLMQIVGCVNDAAFLGLPAETLLCRRPPRVHKYPQPVVTEAVGQLYFAADIEISLLFHDPTPKGKVSTVATGWNYRLGPQLKYWYGRTAAGRPIYRSRSFPTLFRHWSILYGDLT